MGLASRRVLGDDGCSTSVGLVQTRPFSSRGVTCFSQAQTKGVMISACSRLPFRFATKLSRPSAMTATIAPLPKCRETRACFFVPLGFEKVELGPSMIYRERKKRYGVHSSPTYDGIDHRRFHRDSGYWATLLHFDALNFVIWHDHCRCDCHCHCQASFGKKFLRNLLITATAFLQESTARGRGRLAQSHACCAFGSVLLLLPPGLLLLLLFFLFCCFKELRLPLHLANLLTFLGCPNEKSKQQDPIHIKSISRRKKISK